MATQQESPALTMEPSPAESLMSAPGDNYPSLFSRAASAAPSPTLDPMDVMSPPSFGDGSHGSPTPSHLSTVPEDEEANNSSEKKPAKKRKSWGQVLPEPKTNLPPRKRAKTEDEKEQRRVERVLRNRRAAQSSRERKRLEVEALEQKNKELEAALQNARETNYALLEELKRHRRDNGVVVPTVPTGSPLEHTLSSQLFNGQALNPGSLDKLVAEPTVNPASLSPEPTEQIPTVNNETSQPNETGPAASSDTTQHPAEMLYDLQCPTSEEPCLPPTSQTLAWILSLTTLLSTLALSACQRPLTQIAMSLKAGFSIVPSPPILTTIIWLVTRPSTSTRPRSTSTSGLFATSRTRSLRTSSQRATPSRTSSASSSQASTLRVKLLRKILSSSPNLARPLSDATFTALRLVSRGYDNWVEACNGPSLSHDGGDELTGCLKQIDLPSREVLMTLMWTLRVEQRRLNTKKQGKGSSLRPESRSQFDQPTNHNIGALGAR